MLKQAHVFFCFAGEEKLIGRDLMLQGWSPNSEFAPENRWSFPKNGGKHPKMDGENNGKPY